MKYFTPPLVAWISYETCKMFPLRKTNNFCVCSYKWIFFLVTWTSVSTFEGLKSFCKRALLTRSKFRNFLFMEFIIGLHGVHILNGMSVLRNEDRTRIFFVKVVACFHDDLLYQLHFLLSTSSIPRKFQNFNSVTNVKRNVLGNLRISMLDCSSDNIFLWYTLKRQFLTSQTNVWMHVTITKKCKHQRDIYQWHKQKTNFVNST